MDVVYDEHKLTVLLVHLAGDRAGGSTKLNKVLFFADFTHVRRHCRPITGAEYQHLPFGPAPRRLLPIRSAFANDEAAGDLIDEMWRHDQPETLAVLEALGKALPDKRLAKAARKSAMKHRSWLANRR